MNRLIAFATLILLSYSCYAVFGVKKASNIGDKYEAALQKYDGDNIYEAKYALLIILDELYREKLKGNDGIDYNMALSNVAFKLFTIHTFLGEASDATRYLRESCYYYDQFDFFAPGLSKEKKLEVLERQYLEIFENNLGPKWSVKDKGS